MAIKNKIDNLAKQTAKIVGAAMAALTGLEHSDQKPVISGNADSKIIFFKEIGRSKPMPILKLNWSNLDDSQFVASHASHRSHSSHRSHYSHSSHRSGGLFS